MFSHLQIRRCLVSERPVKPTDAELEIAGQEPPTWTSVIIMCHCMMTAHPRPRRLTCQARVPNGRPPRRAADGGSDDGSCESLRGADPDPPLSRDADGGSAGVPGAARRGAGLQRRRGKCTHSRSHRVRSLHLMKRNRRFDRIRRPSLLYTHPEPRTRR